MIMFLIIELKKIIKLLEKKNINILKWMPKCCNVSPIENLFSILKQKINEFIINLENLFTSEELSEEEIILKNI